MKDDNEDIIELKLKISLRDSRWLYNVIVSSLDIKGDEEYIVDHREWAHRMRMAFWEANKCPPHNWDKESGERCVKCGQKDWM
jgi:hypothetical protein